MSTQKKNKIKKMTILASIILFQGVVALKMNAMGLNVLQDLNVSPVTQLIKKVILGIAPMVTMIIGFMGMGRAAYKFMHGDPDSTTALLTAVIGYGLAIVAVQITWS